MLSRGIAGCAVPGVLWTLACSHDIQREAAEASTSSSTTGSELPAACECVGGWSPSCMATSFTVKATCDGPDPGSCEPGTFEVDNSALDSALTALRDRTPSALGWSLEVPYALMGKAGYIVVFADGTAITREWQWFDTPGMPCDAVFGSLPPASDFAGCLVDPNPASKFDCLDISLRAPTTVCAKGDPIATCPW